MKTKMLTILEILAVFALMIALRVSYRSTSLMQWEGQNLGWSYIVPLLWIGIAALVIRLTRRNWAEYGVSSMNWQTNFDIGIKAYLVRFIPIVIGTGGAAWLGLSSNKLGQEAYITLTWMIALALIVWVLNHHKEVKSGRANIIATLLFLLLPVGVALALGKLSLVIVSTVVWQFVFSGFGEEFIYRGYIQSRLNQAFGRPVCLFGIQFGIGLVIASLLFGLLHVFNTYDPAIGFSSLAWGALWGNFLAGLFFGVMREKTGTLLAPGIAHGLPDALGEGLMKVFDWMAKYYQ
jgi:CAAX protease family protein